MKPVALTIAGSDNSAGAGLQADLKTFHANGVYGLTAVTCVVAEVPGCVSMIAPVEQRVVEEQIRLSLKAFPVGAIKTGMLYSRAVIESVPKIYEVLPDPKPKLVVDPVMVATSGDPLLQSDAVAAYEELLFPIATIITPNMDEALALLKRAQPIQSFSDLEQVGKTLSDRYQVPCLMKGGHFKNEQQLAVDFLCYPNSGQSVRLEAPFTPSISTHGTGCTYAAAIAARLARGEDLTTAVKNAKTYLTSAIREFLRWRKTDALHHFFEL